MESIARTMWTGGSSASEIAGALGNVSRNAVIGKIHRMGLNRERAEWTEERTDLLKTRWAAGRSAAEIAIELNCGFSRSAVICKAVRLGLAKKERRATLKGFRFPKGGRAPTRRESIRKRAEALTVEPFDFPEMLEIPVEQRKTLLQLTEHTCKWPIGHPGSEDFYFCGGDTKADLPYCTYHCRIAYRPPEKRT